MRLFKNRGKRKREQLRGRIFGIEQYVPAEDGDALRTTILLKGCPLACVWCQNPEGISPAREPMWEKDKCTSCGACVENASAGGVRLAEGNLLLSPQASESWDTLIAACPSGALRWNSEDRSVDEVMGILRENLAAHQRSGGGVTLSGGDPLLQGPFVKELLTACKALKVSAAMETELFGPWEAIDALARDLDTIYVDLKLLESDQAKRYTGKGTMLIRDNMSRLLESPHKKKVVVRTALIPSITATQENIGSIAQFIAGFDPAIPYELLNYDPHTPEKYRALRRPFFNEDLRPLSQEEMETFVRIAKMNGLESVSVPERRQGMPVAIPSQQ